jgi:hypothetical protein
MTAAQHPTRREAINLIRERSFPTPDKFAVVHTFAGFIGADWDLEDAITFIERSDSIGWADNLMGHDLVVVADRRRINFDVPAPVDVRY